MANIVIKNCNSIEEANILIDIGKLNIKYGINGTGKSTIAKAIEYHNDPQNLSTLLPFKYHEDNPDEIIPVAEGADEFSNVLIFNEEYINKFVFKEDELIENSFEIFIKDEKYQENMNAMESLFSELKTIFDGNENLTCIIEDLNDLGSAFSKTKGGFAKSSKIVKALGDGNKIENIPVGLEDYSDYLKSDENTSWIKWQTTGNSFLDISDKCPYCTSPTSTKIETIKKVSEEYDHKAIEHLLNITKVMDNLSIYFIEDSRDTINNITRNSVGLGEPEEEFLSRIKNQIDGLKTQLVKLKHIAYSTFNNVDNMVDEINNNLKIKLTLFSDLNSETTQEIVNPLNNALDALVTKAGELTGAINKQKGQILRKIEKYKIEINDFLKFAGYQYMIDIEELDDEYKMKLKHGDISTFIEGGSQHLSYGEKNAFALMLFTYECISKNPDLVILDDPISSFDKNKKFAIIERLFRGNLSLKGKTVLMLTHDLEPIVDMLKILSHKFEPKPTASFLSSINGFVSETAITRDDLMTFAQVCFHNLSINTEIIIRLIYLRRYYEVLDDKGVEYQLLSNLFHRREIPTRMTTSGEINMSAEEITEAEERIREYIDTFDYAAQLGIINNREQIITLYNERTSNYEKLQLYRIIYDENHPSNVVQKFINETYHIENEYVSQLDPSKYEMIPEFVIAECDTIMELG